MDMAGITFKGVAKQYPLDENLDFVHVGNLKDKASFSIHCFHKILPYPLPDI